MRYLLLILTFCCFRAGAQELNEDVKKPILALFDGMRKGDSVLLKSAFAPGAILQTIVKNKEGKTVVRSEPVEAFITSVGKPHPEVYDERITFEAIRTDTDLAMAWTPYQFYVGEKFSHCGVNSFQLVRLDGTWKIQYIIDTRRKEGCQ